MTGMFDDREARQRKKQRRIIRTSVWSIGLGTGLLVARYIAPFVMGESAAANAGFSGFGLALLGYGAAQLAAVVFLKKQAGAVCALLTYILMPAVLLWLLAGLRG